jgi:hypothetical protein
MGSACVCVCRRCDENTFVWVCVNLPPDRINAITPYPNLLEPLLLALERSFSFYHGFQF